MSGFASRVRVEDLDGIRWRVLEPLRYVSIAGDTYEVPAGEITDFASSRVWRWNLLPIQWAYSAAPVLHDYLYRSGIVPKATADNLFREALLSLGCDRFTAWKAYCGVAMFGGSAWREHRDNDAAG
jgi:hypothetical protein